MKSKKDKFLEEFANNTPHSGQFDEVKDFEEDLQGGKTFASVRKTLNIKKSKEEKNENV